MIATEQFSQHVKVGSSCRPQDVLPHPRTLVKWCACALVLLVPGSFVVLALLWLYRRCGLQTLLPKFALAGESRPGLAGYDVASRAGHRHAFVKENVMKTAGTIRKLGRIFALATLVMLPATMPRHAWANAIGVSLSGLGTATIDGVLSPGEWSGAGFIDFAVNIPGGGTTPGRVLVMNNATNLYMAIRFNRNFVDPGNSAAVEFENIHGGRLVEGSDGFILNPSIGFRDLVRSTQAPCPAGVLCSFFDTTLGGTNDGGAALLNDGTFTVYEFSHPLDSADNAHDFSLMPGDTVGFQLFIRMIGAGGQFPDGFGDTSFPFPLFGDIVIVPAPATWLLLAVGLAILIVRSPGAASGETEKRT